MLFKRGFGSLFINYIYFYLVSMINWWRFTLTVYKLGVLGTGQVKKRGGGVLGTGQVKKGGSLLRHLPVLDIYVSPPPPPPGISYEFLLIAYFEERISAMNLPTQGNNCILYAYQSLKPLLGHTELRRRAMGDIVDFYNSPTRLRYYNFSFVVVVNRTTSYDSRTIVVRWHTTSL